MDTSAGHHYFDDAAQVAVYLRRAEMAVPAYRDIHRMAEVLLAERVGDCGRILVVGAGGGAETAALAAGHPRWAFTAVDPSEPMLQLARRTLGDDAARVTFHHGYVDSVPGDGYDAATSLLCLHFQSRDERLATLTDIRNRLAEGAPLVVTHVSIPYESAVRQRWLRRHEALLVRAGMAPGDVAAAGTALGEVLPILDPDDDAQVLRDAGFGDVEQFFHGFAYRGWVGYARP